MNTKTKEKEAGTQVKPVGGTLSVPDYMKADAGRGTENLNTTDAEMPRIALMQGLSDEVQTYDGVKVGDFFHTLAEKSLGQKLTITPIYVSKRYVLWNPRWAGGGILARSDDAVHWNPPTGEFDVKLYKDRPTMGKWKLAPTVAESRLDQWGTYDPNDPKSQPAATLCYVIVVAIEEYPEYSPVALMLQRTAVGPARKLIGKLKISQAPSFGLKFAMESYKDSRGENDFQNYRFTASGFVEPEKYDAYKTLHEHFKKEGVQVKDIEGAQDDHGPAATRADTEAAKTETKY